MRPGPWTRTAAAAVLAAAVTLANLVAPRARLLDPAPTLLVQDRHGAFLLEVGDGPDAPRGFWRIAERPHRLARATLAAEDGRFASHPGVDPVAIARAAWQNLREGRRVSGASTLAMQVARMQDPGPRTWGRKVVEACTALALTARFGRDAILDQYLRLAPYGRNLRGGRYAARRYFEKPAADLSWAEAAFLAALPQAPSRQNPFDPAGRARAPARARGILETLTEEGDLTQDGLARELAGLDRLESLTWSTRPRHALHPILELAHRLRPRRRALADRPLVRADLDLALQADLERWVDHTVDAFATLGAGNGALLVLDRETLAVRAAVGSTGYGDAGRAGSIDYTDVPRSPGSTLKPLVYALALDQGALAPDDLLDDTLPGRGGITNADRRFLGPLPPRVALANSRNVPAARLLEGPRLASTYAFFQRLGLHDATQPAEHYGVGLGLGAMPVTLRALARAYGALADDGQLGTLRWYRGEPATPARRVLSAATARQVLRWLSDPSARLPSFPRMGPLEFPFPVASKTGTSSRYRDAWCVNVTRKYLVAGWIGDPGGRPMTHVSGSRAAARMTRGVVMRLHADERDGLADLSLPAPEGYTTARLCARSGRRPTPACPRTFEEFFAPGQAPARSCGLHWTVVVDARTGEPATATTPRALRRPRTMLRVAPEHAAWATRQGLPLLRAAAPPLADLDGVRVRIVRPEDGAQLIRDPEAPPELSTLALGAVVEGPASQVVWYVNGQPVAGTAAPYQARWPLQPGEHVIEARVPYTEYRSAPVRVTVR